jgi:hypothetical protein
MTYRGSIPFVRVGGGGGGVGGHPPPPPPHSHKWGESAHFAGALRPQNERFK